MPNTSVRMIGAMIALLVAANASADEILPSGKVRTSAEQQKIDRLTAVGACKRWRGEIRLLEPMTAVPDGEVMSLQGPVPLLTIQNRLDVARDYETLWCGKADETPL